MMDMKRRYLFSFIVFMSLVSACGAIKTTSSSAVDTTPYWPTDGWRSSTPEEQGMDSQILGDMLAGLIDRGFRIDSISVIRNGYLVLDVAVHPYQNSKLHIVHSCTKSVVSALIGIAIGQGYLSGVEQPLLEIFEDREVANLDSRKQSITLEDLLTMSSGLDCKDSYLYRWRGLEEMWVSGDWVQYVLDLPMADDPGTRFEYCNGGSFLLSAIVQETTGMTALEYAEENLFGPLGITDVDWPSNPDGISIGWGDLRMLPHDMAKIGYLYLNEGEWDGEQVIPSEWVRASTKEHIEATLQPAYGYQWWIDPPDVYMALGYAGQFIFVAPEHDLVAVFTSDLPEDLFYTPKRFLDNYILEAIKSNEPLPANDDAFEKMNLNVQTLQDS
jgi:CubicO group peptidase (beta-lactamase class C family)